ncbi:MAG: response regulator, partial [Candidatus Heimdallarchaeota archaeon]|nr:response regulator [Candidatus Heimdallarchaeota archaeon]
MSALIVDDERLARKELSKMLVDYENIHICGEAEDGPSAIEAIKDTNPDIIFLDIQMPGKSGFDLLEEISTTAKIIFVTAYDEYAIRAFEVNALDYLLKPITTERLQKAIERIELKQDQKLIPEKKINYEDRLSISFNSQLQFLKISSILSITSAGDYTKVVLINNKNGLT